MITKFILKNLNCDACGKVSQMKIKGIKGVTDVRINQRGHEADGELDADRSISIAEIEEILIDTNYKVYAA